MTVLGALLAGHGPRVLQTCRLEGLGGAAYGREAVQAALRSLKLVAPMFDIETPGSGLWLNDDIAIVADLIDGLVQRLWVVSGQTVLMPVASIAVPSDPDLTQAEVEIRFEPLDQVELRPDHATRIAAGVMSWPIEGLSRIRPVVLRAASVGEMAFALVRLEGDAVGRPGIPRGINGVLVVEGETLHRRGDEAERHRRLEQEWTPAL